MSRIVAVSLLVLLAETAQGEWKRYFFGPEVRGVSDSPPAHRLDYFRTHPCERSKESFQFCDSKPSRNRKPPETQVRILGRVGPWSVHEISYTYSDDVDETLTHHMSSVLVETATDELHEVFNSGVFYELSSMFPAKLFLHGQTAILATDFDDGGNYHYVHEHFFVIDKEGVTLLDFAPVEAAAETVVPSGQVMYQPTTQYDFVKHVFRISTERSDLKGGYKVGCCDGSIEVPFEVVGTKVVPGKAKWALDTH